MIIHCTYTAPRSSPLTNTRHNLPSIQMHLQHFWRQNYSYDSGCFSFRLKFSLTTPLIKIISMTIRTFYDHSLRAAPRSSPLTRTRHIHVSPTAYPPFKCTFNTPDVRTLVMIPVVFYFASSFRWQLRSLRSFQWQSVRFMSIHAQPLVPRP